ncbi:DUF4149 domain-containing protein [Pseudomonadota bacterium]|nr:DUF4149 domain-containing protein [Pseudomonadota bacterium]
MKLLLLGMKANLASERLLLTLWVGSLYAIGYLAVPMAFATLGDVTLAGNYAGKLFSAVHYLGLAAGSVLIITKVIVHGKSVLNFWRFWVLVAMFISTIVFVTYLQPEVSLVKQQMHDDSNLIEQFSLLHSISKNLYLLISLFGLALIVSFDRVES